MTTSNNNEDSLKVEFLEKYKKEGDAILYSFLINRALKLMSDIESKKFSGTFPDLEYMYYYEKFLSLYRRECDVTYLNIAKTFRKAAHKIHRILLDKKLTNNNKKFLYLVG